MPESTRLDEFADRLTQARERLARTVATTGVELQALAGRPTLEILEDPTADMAGRILAELEGQERHELDEIDAAQARLAAGVFGVCEDCHQAIPLARLRAMPATRHCARCQRYQEPRR